MFIAVINEGFEIAEEEKQRAQVDAFVKRTEPEKPTASWVSRLNPYRFVKARPKVVSVDNLPANLVLPLGKATMRDFMTTARVENSRDKHARITAGQGSESVIAAVQRAFGKKMPKQNAAASRKSSFDDEGGTGIDLDKQL